MKKITLLLVLSIITSTTWAQNTQLESLFNTFKKAASFKVEFSSEGVDYTLISQGRMFNLKSSDIEVIYDNTDLYSYNKKSNEVMIETLQGSSIMSNPINLFTINLGEFKITKEADTYILTPKLGEKIGIDRAEITLNHGSNSIKSMDIVPNGMYPVTFTIKSVNYNVTPDPTLFKFKKGSYGKAEIVDLRK